MKALIPSLLAVFWVLLSHAQTPDQTRHKYHSQTEPTYYSQSYSRSFATGLVRTNESKLFLFRAPKISYTNTDAIIPKTSSLRGLAGPVEDQGQCGSCWDLALTTALRGTYMTTMSDPGRLSFNYLLNCAVTMSGCNGGDFSAADYLVSPKGVPAYGADGEYIQRRGRCLSRPAIASAISYTLLGTNLGSIPTGTPPSFQDIAYVVGVLHKPLAIDVAVDDNWLGYAGGTYNGCSLNDPDQLNHMIVIEGYDCETSIDSNGNCVFDSKGNLPNGVGTYLIRNSWGSIWGDDGYMTTKATNKNGDRCNAVATDALYFELK